MPSAEEKLHGHSLPARSFVVVWKSSDQGIKPVVKATHWEPGYTDAHQPTEDMAIAYAMREKLKDIDRVRSEWLALNVLAALQMGENQERQADLAAAALDLHKASMPLDTGAITTVTDLPDAYDDHQDH